MESREQDLHDRHYEYTVSNAAIEVVRILRDHNKFFCQYTLALNTERGPDGQIPRNLTFRFAPSSSRTMDAPSEEGVVAIFQSRDGEVSADLKYSIGLLNGSRSRIDLTTPLIDPFIYPLLLKFGETGWFPDMIRVTDGRDAV